MTLYQKVVTTAKLKSEITMIRDILSEEKDHRTDIHVIREGVV